MHKSLKRNETKIEVDFCREEMILVTEERLAKRLEEKKYVYHAME